MVQSCISLLEWYSRLWFIRCPKFTVFQMNSISFCAINCWTLFSSILVLFYCSTQTTVKGFHSTHNYVVSIQWNRLQLTNITHLPTYTIMQLSQHPVPDYVKLVTVIPASITCSTLLRPVAISYGKVYLCFRLRTHTIALYIVYGYKRLRNDFAG